MNINNEASVLPKNLIRDGLISIGIYVLPIILMFGFLALTRQRPWDNPLPVSSTAAAHSLPLLQKELHKYWLTLFILVLGAFEFSLGLYENRWTKNERAIDIVCFAAPYLAISPAIAYFTTWALPRVLPGFRYQFSWVPFLWGALIIAVADDLTQYWYHRLHHQIRFLWRFHRTHHSASYMGMAMAARQNAIYTIFFSQTYLVAALVYLGLGRPAVVVLAVKSVITTLAHSSIPWDKPFYRYKVLHPLAWLLERTISTPATHHAHHAASTDDGVGYYKGNFGNMFFLWDVIFGTGLITRQYPKSYGISHYEGDPWHAQFLWPLFKSDVEGSELSRNGPIVR